MPRRAFALVDLAALVAAGTVGGSVLMVLSPPPAAAPVSEPGEAVGSPGDQDAAKTVAKPTPTDLQLKDATQIRGISQAMIIWSQNNKDMYPLPSAIDQKNTTVRTFRQDGRDKDTTANIFSMLVYNGMISPELCVSAVEANPAIGVDTDYQYDQPKAAAKPMEALWDPAFSADFRAMRKPAGAEGAAPPPAGNVSFAHLQPSSGRLGRWSSTFSATEAQVSNRGPEVFAADRDAQGNVTAVRTVRPNSNTLKMHGAPDSWEGNVAYADCHVNFLTSLIPGEGESFPRDAEKFARGEGGGMMADVIFLDEKEDASGTNAFLGIFTKAGDLPGEYVPIWD